MPVALRSCARLRALVWLALPLLFALLLALAPRAHGATPGGAAAPETGGSAARAERGNATVGAGAAER